MEEEHSTEKTSEPANEANKNDLAALGLQSEWNQSTKTEDQYAAEDEVDRKIRAAAHWFVSEFIKATFMERFRIVLDVILAIIAVSAVWIYGAELHQMKKATTAARDAVTNADLNFRSDERAWLEVVPQATPTPIETPKGLHFSPLFDLRLSIKNTGKTPAKIVKIEDNQRNIPNGKDSKHGVEEAQRSHLLTRPSPSILIPGSDFPWILRGILPRNTEFNGGLMLNQYIGRIDYEDIFGKPHWLTFCYELHDDATPVVCEFGNDGDMEMNK